jgi:hypothetical protein
MRSPVSAQYLLGLANYRLSLSGMGHAAVLPALPVQPSCQ